MGYYSLWGTVWIWGCIRAAGEAAVWLCWKERTIRIRKHNTLLLPRTCFLVIPTPIILHTHTHRNTTSIKDYRRKHLDCTHNHFTHSLYLFSCTVVFTPTWRKNDNSLSKHILFLIFVTGQHGRNSRVGIGLKCLSYGAVIWKKY